MEWRGIKLLLHSGTLSDTWQQRVESYQLLKTWQYLLQSFRKHALLSKVRGWKKMKYGKTQHSHFQCISSPKSFIHSCQKKKEELLELFHMPDAWQLWYFSPHWKSSFHFFIKPMTDKRQNPIYSSCIHFIQTHYSSHSRHVTSAKRANGEYFW